MSTDRTTTVESHTGGWVPEKYAWLPAALALSATAIIGVSHLLLFFFVIPKENINLITQNNTTLWNGWMAILMFYFGDSLSRSRSADTIKLQAQTAHTAGVTLARVAESVAPPVNEVKLEPGEKATVMATEPGNGSPGTDNT